MHALQQGGLNFGKTTPEELTGATPLSSSTRWGSTSCVTSHVWFVILDISKLGSGCVHLLSVVVIEHGSRLPWRPSCQRVGSVSLPVDSGWLWSPWPVECNGKSRKGYEASFWSSHRACSSETPSWEAACHCVVRNLTHKERPRVGRCAGQSFSQ